MKNSCIILKNFFLDGSYLASEIYRGGYHHIQLYNEIALEYLSITKYNNSNWEIGNSFEFIWRATRNKIDWKAYLKSNYSEIPTGEYSIFLHVKPTLSLLDYSYQQALRRVPTLERRLQLGIEVKQQYAPFIKEYLELQHVSPLLKSPPSLQTYFIPFNACLRTRGKQLILQMYSAVQH